MIYTYYRVSTSEQDYNNQKLGILEFCKKRNLKIDKEYIDNGISGSVDYHKRQLGILLKKIKSGDIIICSEISRLGRKLFDIMEILKILMEKQVKLYTIKENYELGDNIQSKVLAFAFGISAEIERKLISERTKEALARKKAEGVHIGRPFGRKNTTHKLTKYKTEIYEMLKNNYTYGQISKIYKVHRTTVYRFIQRDLT